MLIAGVVPPLEAIGAVPVTLVIVPTDMFPLPKREFELIVFMLVPETKADCLPLNVDQSVEFKKPLLLPLAD